MLPLHDEAPQLRNPHVALFFLHVAKVSLNFRSSAWRAGPRANGVATPSPPSPAAPSAP